MKAHIIKIGNSQGIRIPKLLLTQCHLKAEVELEPHKNELVIRSSRSPREGWRAVFQQMAQNKDDQLIEGFPASEAWSKEWIWK